MRLAVWAAAALTACSSPAEPSATARRPAKPEAGQAEPLEPLDLEWDDARGWEPRIEPPGDGRTHTVPPGRRREA